MMRLLAVDSASRRCSVAVTVKKRLAAEVSVESGRTHSTHLLRMIQAALRLSRLDLVDIDAFAVTNGPGSFTGLRIGLSMVKGLAFATDKPCVGVSCLDALAHACLPWPHGVCALMDARKQEVYAALYQVSAEGRLERTGDERVLPLEEAIRPINTPHLFVGEGACLYRDRITARLGGMAYFAAEDLNLPRASAVASLGASLLGAPAGGDIDRLVARYLRSSDAELKITQATGTTAADGSPSH